MKEYLHVVGKKHFNETPITITDPCYDDNTWCVLRHKIPEGIYICAYYDANFWYRDEKNKRAYYKETTSCLLLNDKYSFNTAKKYREIGGIGVDAGLAGFYQNKTNYADNDDLWGEFCNKVAKNNWKYLLNDEGFCTSSGPGDGFYPVFEITDLKTGDIIGLEIRFY